MGDIQMDPNKAAAFSDNLKKSEGKTMLDKVRGLFGSSPSGASPEMKKAIDKRRAAPSDDGE